VLMDDVLLPKNSVQIIRGTSKTLQLSVVDSNRKPVNLTGTTIIMTVKETVDNHKNIFQKTTNVATQIQITDPFGGVAQIFITPADTQNLDIKQYVFDVWVILTSGARYAVVPPTIFDLQAGVTVWPV
jgi:hypothetical protein